MTVTPNKAFIVDIVLILCLWLAGSILVDPIGDFPLNDDWSYGLTTRHLLESGDYRPHGWADVPLVTHVLWGALFCLPQGFSFTALRLSTLVAALLGVIGAYVLSRDLRQPRWLAALIALTLGFNPIYYALSYTFMTDVPFTAAAIWSTVFLARNLRTGSTLQTILGTALAVVATLSRQLALCIPLAFAITALWRSGITARAALRAFTPLMVCGGAFAVFKYWLLMTGRSSALLDLQTVELLRDLTHLKSLMVLTADNTVVALFYVGLFLLPVLIVSWRDSLHARAPRAKLLIAIGALLMLAGYVFHLHYNRASGNPLVMPLSENILINSGIGPFTLRDVDLLRLHVTPLPSDFWVVVTLAALAAAAALIAELGFHVLELVPRLRRGRMGDIEAASLFLTLGGILYALPILAEGSFDRYYLPLIPFLAASLVSLPRASSTPSIGGTRPVRLLSFALLTAFGLFAVGATRDYLAWNRVRWQALHELMRDRQVAASEIDGGFEFNGLYLYDPRQDIHRPDRARSWWWVQHDTYQIGLGAVPGYVVIKEYTYQHWLPPHPQKVVVLRKE